jgi:hypothetical protein
MREEQKKMQFLIWRNSGLMPQASHSTKTGGSVLGQHSTVPAESMI